MDELNLWLDNYTDLYSDFDPRQFQKRRVSEDFISELKLAMRQGEEIPKLLVLAIPSTKRDPETEKIIAKSLQTTFQNQKIFHSTEYRRTTRKGLMLLLSGVIAMIINLYIINQSNNSFLLSAIRLLLEPAGWFLLWTGLDTLYYELREKKKERTFFRNLSGMEVQFTSY